MIDESLLQPLKVGGFWDMNVMQSTFFTKRILPLDNISAKLSQEDQLN